MKKFETVALIMVILVILAMLVGLVLLVSKPAHGAEANDISGECTIFGYEPEKYVIDKDKENQVFDCAMQIEERQPKAKGYVLKALVSGSADTSGDTVKNQGLSGQRAEPIAAILRNRLPVGSFVEVIPKGDSENKRQVRVEWKYVYPPTVIISPLAPAPDIVVQAKKEIAKKWLWTIVIIFGIVILIGGTVAFLIGERRKTSPRSEPSEPHKDWIEVKLKNGEEYSVETEVKDGKYFSPFTVRSGHQIIIGDLGDYKHSLRGCLIREEFAEQKEKLIREGKIKVPGER